MYGFFENGAREMLMGIKLKARPTADQRLILSQWMGCARVIWNAKVEEELYLRTFAAKYLCVGTYAPIDQKFSQYKDSELTPWLNECPSQILRNSAVNWYQTYQKFMKGECGRPRRKRKDDGVSIHLTSELFRFETDTSGAMRLFIGTKTNNIGYLALVQHRMFQAPKSIHVKKRQGGYWVSFCYEDGLDESLLATQSDHLAYLRGARPEYLDAHTVGIDRGVVRPVQAGAEVFDLTDAQKRNKLKKEKALLRYQRRMARQKKGSGRRNRIKMKLSRCHEKIANIRKDFCHKTSHSIVSKPENKVIVLEDLRVKNMTASPEAKQDEQTGQFQPNGATAKAGLNRAILDKGWFQLEAYIKYKAHRAGKAWFKVPAHHTSQECAACGHTHPSNRTSQSRFVCTSCGHIDNADHNAAEVIKKRAIRMFLHSGTELSKRGVLQDTGRGAPSWSDEASKKKRKAAKAA
jgi:putative transposase